MLTQVTTTENDETDNAAASQVQTHRHNPRHPNGGEYGPDIQDGLADNLITNNRCTYGWQGGVVQ